MFSSITILLHNFYILRNLEGHKYIVYVQLLYQIGLAKLNRLKLNLSQIWIEYDFLGKLKS